MHNDVDQTAAQIAELLPAVAINLRVGALFDATTSDLTANQLMALIVVAHAEKSHLRAGDIARRMFISAASATALVDRLVESGMLVRTRGDDRRVVWVSPTEAGKDLIIRLKAGTITRISAVLSKSTPEKRLALLEALQHVTTFTNQFTDEDATF